MKYESQSQMIFGNEMVVACCIVYAGVLTCIRRRFRKNIHHHRDIMDLSRSRLRWIRENMNNSMICQM